MHGREDAGLGETGFAMAGLLVVIGVMSVFLSVLAPSWSHMAKREREAELVFRGEQYARAVELYQRRYVGAYPPDLDTLLEERFLRRAYEDPMQQVGAEDRSFQLIYRSQLGRPNATERDEDEPAPRQGFGDVADPPEESAPDPQSRGEDVGQIDLTAPEQGGIVGVVSSSTDDSLRLYNGRQTYSEWLFLHAPTETQPGEPTQGDGPRTPRRGRGGEPIGAGRSRFTLGGR